MKKYTAKHPDGTTYELTLEEMQSPQIIQQLQIDSSWSVKMGEKWESFNAFLWEQNQKQTHKPVKSADGATLPKSKLAMEIDTQWSPGSVFGLAVRLVGLYLALKGAEGFVTLVVGFSDISMNARGGVPAPSIGNLFFKGALVNTAYLVLGLFLVRRPHTLVS
jgi:hypothetical protein